MGRDGFLAVIFLFLIVADPSSAWSLRKLIRGEPENNSSATDIPPLPSPGSSGKDSKARKVNPKGSNNDDNKTASAKLPAEKQIDNENDHGGKAKIDGKTSSQSGSNGSCKGSANRCSVQKTMIVACIPSLESGSKDLILLVQNKGESIIVNITVSTSLKNDTIEHEIPKQQTKKINISSTSTEIVLTARNETCVLHNVPHLSEGNFLQRLPSYYKQVTPIYVAYFVFLIALIVGGTWACCKFAKRRRQDGVPYRELEMGLPDSASAVNVDSAEGWDEVWDDDWDEDKAVKSPGGRHVGNISANGLTARSSNRDGWEKDWDD